MINKTVQLQRKVFSARCSAENYFDRVLGELDRLMETCETLHPNTALKRENEQLKKQVEELTLKLNAVHHEAKMFKHTKQDVLDALHLCDGVRELTAKELNISVFTLYKAIERFGIIYPARRRKKVVNGEVTWVLKSKYK